MLSAKQRDIHLQSYDDGNYLDDSWGNHPSGRSLHIPKHARAASAPVHIEQQMRQMTVDTKPQHHRGANVDSSTANQNTSSLLSFTNEKPQKLNAEMVARKSLTKTKHNTSLKATPELLAELLKGSSEKMVTSEQKKKCGNRTGSEHPSALPTAVLKCLVSRSSSIFIIFHVQQNDVVLAQITTPFLTRRECA